jgi:hypothetical protein
VREIVQAVHPGGGVVNVSQKPAELVAVTPTMRDLIENIIEDLLLLLDEIDGDENREPDLAGFDHRFMDDREVDDDFEPSIGSPNDLERDDAELDEPGFIEGGQGL